MSSGRSKELPMGSPDADEIAATYGEVENYFLEFAKMRKEREERQKEEREKQKQQEKEMEEKKNSIKIEKSVTQVTEDDESGTTTKSIDEYAAQSGLDVKKGSKSTRHIRDRTSSKDFSTVNRYGKKKRRKSKTKFGRSKVAAMIAGFEQIEKKV